MSHTVRHKMQKMKSKLTLIKAFNVLGWQVVQNAKCRTWAYNPDRDKVYELVAKNPRDGYDLGIVEAPNGTLEIHGDTSMMGPDVWAALGTGFSKLQQQYAVQEVLDWVDQRNGSATQNQMANGVIEMELDVEVFV